MSQPELNSAIEKIDADLARNSAPLLGRPFEAYRELDKRFGTPGRAFEPFGTELFQEIYDWYLSRYGQQMNPEIKLGEKPILIRGVLCFMRFPVVYGAVQIDIFQHIEGIAPGLLTSLSNREIDEIASAFEKGCDETTDIEEISLRSANATQEIQDLVSRGLVDIAASIAVLKATSDLQGAIFHGHGAVEKFIKAVLAIRTGDTLENIVRTKKVFGNSGHDLPKGLQALENIDARFASISVHVATVHLTDMKIRYEEQSRSVSDALSRIDAVFAICAFIAKQL